MEQGIQDCISGFEQAYHSKPVVGWAPGRVNLMGDHTDYSDGFSLPIAIDLGIAVAFRPSTDNRLVATAENLQASVDIELSRQALVEQPVWVQPERLPPWAQREKLGRWFTASHNQGFMLVEADDAKPLFRWVSEWASLLDFSIEPVLDEEEAAAVLMEERA